MFWVWPASEKLESQQTQRMNIARLNPSLMYILKEPFIYYTSCPLLSYSLPFPLSDQPTAVDEYSRWRSVKRNTVSHAFASMQKGGAGLRGPQSATLLHRCKRVALDWEDHSQPLFCIDAKGWRCIGRTCKPASDDCM
jgi:hypothetical protein